MKADRKHHTEFFSANILCCPQTVPFLPQNCSVTFLHFFYPICASESKRSKKQSSRTIQRSQEGYLKEVVESNSPAVCFLHCLLALLQLGNENLGYSPQLGWPLCNAMGLVAV